MNQAISIVHELEFCAVKARVNSIELFVICVQYATCFRDLEYGCASAIKSIEMINGASFTDNSARQLIV